MSIMYKGTDPLGTFSSGGHTILNKLKQALTQRTKLMFGGGLKATDNSQDGITLVDDSADEIEFSDWIAKTEEEKEEYAEEHAKFDIINAPGVDELVELKLLTKLWENSAPTQAFAAQSITLASDDYDMLLINFSANVGFDSKLYTSIICEKGKSFILNVGRLNYSRNGVYISDSSYNIQTGIDASGNQSNNYCVPTTIYGFKANIKSIISAIASDVSTSASKCLMSDGETSVEDTLNYSTDEHVVGKWIDGSTLYEKTVNFGTLPNNTGRYTAHGISNLSTIVGVEAVGIRSDRTFPIPNSGANSSESGYGMRMFVDKTSGIYIATGQDMTDTTGYVTLRYTKTS